MPPCLGALDFFVSIERFNPIVLTACSKSNYINVARQKREWVRKHLSASVTVLPVHGSRSVERGGWKGRREEGRRRRKVR